MAFLAAVVFYHDKKSFTNKIFIFHSIVAVAWSISNYFSVSVSPDKVLFWIRLVIFFAIPYVMSFFIFVQNFPETKLVVSRYKIATISIITIGMMVLAISPLVFSGIQERGERLVSPVAGKAIPFFGPLLILFFIWSFALAIRKYFKSIETTRRQWLAIGIGLSVAFTLLIFLVFVRVIAYGDTSFVIYSPLFILPIFIGSAFAILKHHLFNVKVIATEILTFLLLITSLLQLFLSENTLIRTINSLIIIFVLYFGILLIKSVLREVKQREELQKLTVNLEKANKELEKLSRFKTQILSFASHQIKAPLATIKGFASIITEGLYGEVNDKIKETIGKMKASADELISLINTLLDMRKVEEGKMEYKFETVKIKDLVQSVYETLKVQAEAKKLEFNFNSGSEAAIKADPQKLKQVIQNLAENAIKYTPQGFVKLETKEDSLSNSGQASGYVIFSVSDSGLGIGPNLFSHLFDQEFVRDDRIKREVKGTGLGLYIAKRIVTDHGGTIWAESQGEGRGSTFYVKLRKI